MTAVPSTSSTPAVPEGHPIRSLNDCLIAAIALRTGTAVAHRDADFEYIAAATGLGVVDLRG